MTTDELLKAVIEQDLKRWADDPNALPPEPELPPEPLTVSGPGKCFDGTVRHTNLEVGLAERAGPAIEVKLGLDGIWLDAFAAREVAAHLLRLASHIDPEDFED